MTPVHVLLNDSFRPILILSFHLSLRIVSGYFLHDSPPKSCVHHFSPPYVPHTRMISFFLIRSHVIISGEDIRPIELNSRYFLIALVFGERVCVCGKQKILQQWQKSFKCYSRQAFFPLTSELLYVQYVVLEFSRHLCWEYKHNLCFGNYFR